jgi:hypothetical protein
VRPRRDRRQAGSAQWKGDQVRRTGNDAARPLAAAELEISRTKSKTSSGPRSARGTTNLNMIRTVTICGCFMASASGSSIVYYGQPTTSETPSESRLFTPVYGCWKNAQKVQLGAINCDAEQVIPSGCFVPYVKRASRDRDWPRRFLAIEKSHCTRRPKSAMKKFPCCTLFISGSLDGFMVHADAFETAPSLDAVESSCYEAHRDADDYCSHVRERKRGVAGP